jgi:hypothetical protein
MKHSLWIVASGSLLIFLCAIIFVFFTIAKKPKFQFLRPSFVQEISTKKLLPEEIVKIYENDLFDTYIPKPVLNKIESKPRLEKPQMPRVPDLISPPASFINEINFLEPIPYTLVGTVVSPVDSESIVVVSDNRTKKEKSYFLGEEIEDSQIVDIGYKSVTILRSNGQKETLFLPGFDKILKRFNDANQVFAQRVDRNSYVIDPDLFINKIRTLGNLISQLNIITAYQDGISIGCKIGNILEDSIAPMIGLEKGDIILKINDLPVATLDQRLQVYDSIINLKNGAMISISIIRDNQELQLKYTIDKLDSNVELANSIKNLENADLTNKMIREDLERRYKFAPTIAEIKDSEREAIIKQLNKNKLV